MTRSTISLTMARNPSGIQPVIEQQNDNRNQTKFI